MAKATYASLKLKTNNELKTFKFQDNDIEILSYLPVEDKIDLIDVTLQKSKRGNIYSSILLDMYFHLHLVYLYTNLGFTEKQKENETKLYDTLKSNGFIDEMLKAINEDEYNELLKFLEEEIEKEEKYNNSAKGLIDRIPSKAQEAADILNSFDSNKFNEFTGYINQLNAGNNK